MTDHELNRRITDLRRRLTETADRHGALLDRLRPKNPKPWPQDEPLVYSVGGHEAMVIR